MLAIKFWIDYYKGDEWEDAGYENLFLDSPLDQMALENHILNFLVADPNNSIVINDRFPAFRLQPGLGPELMRYFLQEYMTDSIGLNEEAMI